MRARFSRKPTAQLSRYTETGLKDFAITKGIDNARLDAAATLPLELGFAGTKDERQVEAGEHRVGVLSQLLLDIATIPNCSQD